MNSDRGTWSSKLTFVFAAAGSAVGLGNLWRFSYEAGKKGGGLFVLIYLCAVLLIALPILLAELSMGRFSNKNTVGAFEAIKPKTPFKGIGYLGLMAAVMILAFYSVIAGQTVGYIYKFIAGDFAELSKATTAEEPSLEFKNILLKFNNNPQADPEEAKAEIINFFNKYKLAVKTDKTKPEIKEQHNPEEKNAEKEDQSPYMKDVKADLEKFEFKDHQDNQLLIDSLEVFYQIKNQTEESSQETISEITKDVEIKFLVNKSKDIFDTFTNNKTIQVILVLVFLFLTIFIVSKGISGGIEKFTKIFMPVLLVILFIMIFRAITLPNAFKGISFYLAPKFSDLTPGLVISAIGQAFFSLSLGMGTMITYGSYVSKRDKLPNSAGMIGLFDTSIAILAGFIVFPVIFSLAMSPDQGAGGIFNVLPILFSKIPLGQIFGIMFFVLLGIAALTSTISLLEVPVAYMVDEKNFNRRKAAYLVGGITLIFAIPSALSEDFFSLWNTVWGSLALTLGGFFIAIFVGWVWKTENALKEILIGKEKFRLAGIWSFLIKYFIPLCILVILVTQIVNLF